MEAPQCHRAKNPVDQEAQQHQTRISAIINNHRGTSGYLYILDILEINMV
ncbi:MAG: hypothetical protein RQ885_06205 [Desulfurococcales archaeon]|nr:hypothetical protein [Desulfurococcales archaeon]